MTRTDVSDLSLPRLGDTASTVARTDRRIRRAVVHPRVAQVSTITPAPPVELHNRPRPSDQQSAGSGHMSVIWVLFGGTLLVRALGFAYPFLAYHVDGRGHGAQAVGMVLAAFGAGWVVGQLAGGWMVDRIGGRHTLLATMTLAAAAMALVAEAHDFSTLLIGAAVVGMAYDTPRVVLGAKVTDLIPDPARRAKLDAWRFGLVVNGGAAIAGSVGVLLADWIGLSTLYWVNAIACAGFALVALYCLPPDKPRRTAGATTMSYTQAFADPRMLVVFLASVATLTAVVGLYSAVPMIMSDHGLSASAYGITQLADAVAIMALTPLMSPWLSRRLAVRPRLDIVAGAAAWAVAWMGVAAFATTTVQFAVAVAAAAPGVIAWFIATNDIVHRIAPPTGRGRYHGIWGAALAVAAIVAPMLAAYSLDHGGHAVVALTTLAVGLIGAVLFVPLRRVLVSGPPTRVIGAARHQGHTPPEVITGPKEDPIAG